MKPMLLPQGLELERVLKENAHTSVVVARQRGDRSRVVVKTVGHKAPERIRNLFLRDAHLRSELHHPGLCPVLAIGCLPDRSIFSVSPYIERADPHRWILRDGLERSLAFAGRLAEPITYLHERGHTHGDIKPANILFQASNEKITRLCVTDLLPLMFRREQQFGMLTGTLAYLAPEAIRGEDIDHRSDLYSFGATLYEVFMGRPLFEGDATELARAHLTVPAETRFPRDSTLPGALWQGLSRLLEKDPGDRFHSIEEFVESVSGKPRRRSERVRLATAPPYVDRMDTEKRIRAWFRNEENRCLLLLGAQGSGKTRLLRRFAEEVRLQGHTVVAIGGRGISTLRPFDGTRRLFSALSGEALGFRLLAGEERAWADDPRRLKDPEGEISLFRMLRSRWISMLAGPGTNGNLPPLVIIDDVDAFDPVSIRFLEFLIRLDWTESVRYLLSHGSSSNGSGGDSWLARDGSPDARHERLAPFSGEEVERWIQGAFSQRMIDPGVVRSAVLASGGNPAVLVQVAREWLAQGDLRVRGGELRLSPSARSHRSGERPASPDRLLHDLSPPSRELAAAIALAPGPRDASFFQRILPLPAHEFPTLVLPLLDRGLVQREPRPLADVYFCPSGEIRDILRAAIPPDRRKGLCRIAARVAEQEGRDGDPGPLFESGAYWEMAGHPRSAARVLLRAAKSFERMGLARETADAYRRTLRIPGGLVHPIERAKALLALAAHRQMGGEPGSALAALRLLARVVRDDGPASPILRNARRLEAWIRFHRGERVEAESVLQGLLRAGGLERKDEAALRCDLSWFLLARGGAEEALVQLGAASASLDGARAGALPGRIENRTGAVAFYRRDWKAAGTRFERASRLLEKHSPRECASALANLGLVRFWMGRLREARSILENALQMARRAGDLQEEARVVEDLGRVLFRLGETEEASRCWEEALAIHADFADLGGRVRVLLSQGQMEKERGRLDQSLGHLARGVELARGQGNPFTLLNALNLLALTHVAREEGPLAEAALDEAASLLDKDKDGRIGALLAQTRGRLAMLRRDHPGAERHLSAATERFLRNRERDWAAETLLLWARARLDGAGLPTPRPVLARAERLLKKSESPWLEARLSLLSGRLQEGRGDEARAEALYRDAIKTARRLDARLDLAEALGHLAFLGARRGDRRRAEADLEEATALYRALPTVTPPSVLARARASLAAPDAGGGEEFRVLCRLAATVNSLGDSGEILDHVLDQAINYLRAERGLLLLYGARGELLPRVARSLSGEDLRDVTRLSKTLFRRAAESEDPIVAGNALADPRFEGAESISEYNILSVACAPLRSKGRPIGFIYVDNRATPNLFTPGDETFLRALADLAGIALENARLIEDLRLENDLLKEEIERGETVPGTVARSRCMQEVLRQLRTAARSDITVLLLGETGSGKGLAARFLHRESARRDEPFLPVNCSAIVSTLVETELFGHEPGAFTDAKERRAGVFERAHRGTLLLDEIGDMPLDAQVKLLRVLQEGEFERVGGTETLRSNVRIVAASNQDLEALVAQGKFRGDLFWRLNALTIEIPPLRSRREDIPDLARHFLDAHARKNRKKIHGISGGALALLESYHWPGNVRQLDHVIERAVVLASDSVLDAHHLGEEIRRVVPSLLSPPAADDHGGTRYAEEIQAAEGEVLRKVLAATGWNKSEAARILGIHESTVRKKIQLLGLARFAPPEGLQKRRSYRRPKS